MTAAFVAAALAASLLPAATAAAIHDRAAVDGGAWWRLLSAHLVHSSLRMGVLDLGAVALLGSWVERRSRSALVAVLLASALAVGLAVHLLHPGLARYHGASGVACALFAWVVVDLVRHARSTSARWLALLALALFLAKSAWEVGTGRSLAAGVDVVPGAHLVGALIGLMAGILRPGHPPGRWTASTRRRAPRPR